MANQDIRMRVKYSAEFDTSKISEGLKDIKKQISNQHIGEELQKQLQAGLNKLEVKLPELEKFANKDSFSTKELEQYQKLINELQSDLLKFNELATKSDFKSNFSIIDNRKIQEFDNQIQQIEDRIASFKQEMINTFEASNGKVEGSVSNVLSELFSVDPDAIESKFDELVQAASEEVESIDQDIEKLLSGKKKYTGKELIEVIFGDESTVKTAKDKAGQLTSALKSFIEQYRDIDPNDLESKAKLIQQVKDLLYGKAEGIGQVFNNPNGEKLFGKISEEDLNSIKELKNHLEDIQNISKEKIEFIDEAEAQKANLTAEKAKLLNDILNDLVNTQDLTIDGAEKLAKALATQSREVAEAAHQSRQQDIQMQALKDTFGSLASKIDNTVSAMAIFNKSMQIVRSAIKSVEELDAAFTQIAIVSEQSSESAWKMFDSFNSLAKQYSITTKDLTEGAKLFYQQGLSAADTMKMVEASTVSAALGEVTMTEAANTLTAAIQGYNESAAVAMDYTDKIAMVGAVSAADFNELSVAMEKTASSAYTAGIDFDHLLGYLGKMIEVTREAPANLGTAMKTIIARFEDMKKDPMAILEDGVTANKVEAALASVGIALRNSEGEFRALQDVMDELGIKWDSLSRNQQAYIATVAAGSRQQSRFLALMNNYDRTLDLIAESQNSAGAAAEQYATYQDSIAAAQARLAASWEKFYSKIVDNDLIKFAINGLATLVDALSKVPPAITAIGVAFGALKLRESLGKEGILGVLQKVLFGSNSKSSLLGGLEDEVKEQGSKLGIEFIKSFADKSVKETWATHSTSFIGGLSNIKDAAVKVTTQGIGALKGGFSSLISVITGAINAGVAFIAAYWPILAIGAAVALVIWGVVSALTKQKKEYEENIEKIKEYNQESEELANRSSKGSDLFKTYDELSKKINLTESEQAELNDTIKQISELYPEAIEYTDEYGNKQLANADNIKEVIKAEKELAQIRKIEALEKREETLDKNSKYFKKEDFNDIGYNSRYTSQFFNAQKDVDYYEDLTKLKWGAGLTSFSDGLAVGNLNYNLRNFQSGIDSGEIDKLKAAEYMMKDINRLIDVYGLKIGKVRSASWDLINAKMAEINDLQKNVYTHLEDAKKVQDKAVLGMHKETEIDLAFEKLFYSDNASIETSQRIVSAQIKAMLSNIDVDFWPYFLRENGGSADSLAESLQDIIDTVSKDNALEMTQLFKDFKDLKFKNANDFYQEFIRLAKQSGNSAAASFAESFETQLKAQLKREKNKYKEYLMSLGFNDGYAIKASDNLQLGEGQKRQDYIKNYLGEDNIQAISSLTMISSEALAAMEEDVAKAVSQGDLKALEELPLKWQETWNLLGNIAADAIATSRVGEEIEKVAQDACNRALDSIGEITDKIFSNKDFSSMKFDESLQYYDYFNNEDGSNTFFDHAEVDETGQLIMDLYGRMRIAQQEYNQQVQELDNLIAGMEVNSDRLTEDQKKLLDYYKNIRKEAEKHQIVVEDVLDLTEDIQKVVKEIEIPNGMGKMANESARALKTSIDIGKEYEGIVKSAKELEKQMRDIGHVDDDIVNQLLQYGSTFADFFVIQDDGTIRMSLENVVGDYASAGEAIIDIAKKRQEAELEIKREEMLQEAEVAIAKAEAYEELERLCLEYVNVVIDNNEQLTEDQLKLREEEIIGEVQAQQTAIQNAEETYNSIQKAAELAYENLANYDTAFWSSISHEDIAGIMRQQFQSALSIEQAPNLKTVQLMTNHDREGLINAADTYRKAAEGLRQYAERLRTAASKLKVVDPSIYQGLADKLEQAGKEAEKAGKEGEKAGQAIAKAVTEAAEAITRLNDLVVELKDKLKELQFNPQPFTEVFEAWEHEWDYFFNINNLRNQIETQGGFIDNIISSTYASSEKKLQARQAKIGNIIAKISANDAYTLATRAAMAQTGAEIMEKYGEHYRIDPETMRIYQHDATLESGINDVINANRQEIYDLTKENFKEKEYDLKLAELKLQALEAGKEALEKSLEEVEGTIENLSDENITADLSGLEDEKLELETAITAKQEDIDEIKETIRDLTNEISEQEALISFKSIGAQQVEDEVEDMIEAVEKYQEYWENLNSVIAEQQELLQELSEIRDYYVETAIDTEQQIYNAIVEKYQKEIDQKKKQYDYLKQLDQEYLDSVREAINKEKEMREQANQQKSYQQNVQRAQLLEMDTSSAFKKELMSLKKEIEQQRQEMYDNLVSEQVAALEKEVERRHELYDKELEALEEHLAYVQENSTLLWESVYTIVSNGSEAMMAVLENTTEYINANELQRMQLRETWEENVKTTFDGVENDTINFLNNLITIGETSIEEKLPEIGDALSDYTEVFNTAKEKVEEYDRNLEDASEKIAEATVVFDNIIASFMQTWLDRTANLTGYSENWEELVGNLKSQTQGYLEEIRGYYDEEGNVREELIGSIEEFNEEVQISVNEMYQDFLDERDRYREELEGLIISIRDEIEQAAKDAADAIRSAVETAMANISYGGDGGSYGGDGGGGDDPSPGPGGDGGGDNGWGYTIEYMYNGIKSTLSNTHRLSSKAEAEDEMNERINKNNLWSGLINAYTFRYKLGGLADFTGPAWLDGTKSNPERVLSPKQTKLFESMVSSLERTANNSGINSSFGPSYNIGEINTTVQVDKLDNDTDIDMVARKVENRIMNSIKNRVTVSIR